jgi:hypothetical protein
LTKKVSFGSGDVSPLTETLIVRVVCPAQTTPVPLPQCSHRLSTAVRGEEIDRDGTAAGARQGDVKAALVEPLLPSVTATSLIDNVGVVGESSSVIVPRPGRPQYPRWWGSPD